MSKKSLRIANLQLLTIATGLSLAIGLQAFAESQLEQPRSVANGVASISTVVVDQAQGVTPAGCTDSCCGGGECCVSDCCGSCCGEAVCCPNRVTEEVKKHCWKVKYENVCIPGFRFECNWVKKRNNGCDCGDTCCSSGSCGTPTCGRVRCIKVLEKHEYTCDKCGYEWEVKCVRSGNNCNGDGGCCCPKCGIGGCCASTDTENCDIQLTSATDAAADVEAESEKPSLARRLMPWLK